MKKLKTIKEQGEESSPSAKNTKSNIRSLKKGSGSKDGKRKKPSQFALLSIKVKRRGSYAKLN